jgi:hypothetical protein
LGAQTISPEVDESQILEGEEEEEEEEEEQQQQPNYEVEEKE